MGLNITGPFEYVWKNRYEVKNTDFPGCSCVVVLAESNQQVANSNSGLSSIYTILS